MEKWVKWNTGRAIDKAAISTLALFILWWLSENKKVYFLFLFALIVFLYAAISYAFADTCLTNESDDSVFVKPEEGDESIEVQPGETVYGLDGVKTKGRVYKISDGIHATVLPSGEVVEKSCFFWLVNTAHGGILEAPPDAGWQKLFDK